MKTPVYSCRGELLAIKLHLVKVRVRCYNMLMLFADLLGWWYGRGWAWAAKRLFIVHAGRILQFFSIEDLLKTLFSPFRQDSLETRGASISIKLQVLGGNIISRFFGFIIRTVLILLGLVSAVVCYTFGLLVMLIWPLVPVSPLIVLVLILTGVGV